MNDLISKQVLLYALDYKKFIDGESIDINELKSLIKRIPIIEPEPVKHGHWMDSSESTLHCSYCHRYVRRIIPRGYDYCPHCGAKMDDQEAQP